jgi:hypothetical protein
MNPFWKWIRGNVMNLKYTTEKVTVLRDWRLACMNISLSTLVVIWVLYSLFTGKTYIVTEVPTGVASAWGLGSSITERPSFCNNLSPYAFNYSADWYYKVPTCAEYTGSELISKLPTGNVIFFTTHISQTIKHRYPKPPTGCLSESYGLEDNTISSNACEHSTTSNFLATGIEDSIFAFNHYFDSSIDTGSKPITYIRKEGSDENIYTFNEGQSIRLKMSEWLDLAGIDLDKRLDDQGDKFTEEIQGFNGAGNDTNTYPYVRTSGLRLNIKVKYHNYFLDKDIHTNIGNKDVYAVINVVPRLGWFSKGDEISYKQAPESTSYDINNPIDLVSGNPNGIYTNMYRYGVLFDIQQSGLVGKIDYVFILIQLTSGLVMLGVASSIVSFVAKFLMGDISNIYKSVIQEEYDVAKEAAKYAAQACVASKSFKEADQDGRGDLDFEELKNLVRECFSKTYILDSDNTSESSDGFTEDDITAMTFYLMRAADDKLNDRILEKREKTMDDLKKSKITLHEWQELCTGGVLERKSLRKIMDFSTFIKEVREKISNKDKLKKLFLKNK